MERGRNGTVLCYFMPSGSIHGLSPLIKSNVDDLRKFRNEDFAYMTREKKNWNESSLRVEQERSYKRMSRFLGARGWGGGGWGGGVLS